MMLLLRLQGFDMMLLSLHLAIALFVSASWSAALLLPRRRQRLSVIGPSRRTVLFRS